MKSVIEGTLLLVNIDSDSDIWQSYDVHKIVTIHKGEVFVTLEGLHPAQAVWVPIQYVFDNHLDLLVTYCQRISKSSSTQLEDAVFGL